MAEWIDACSTDDIDQEEVIRFDHGARTFRDTDGLCTREEVHLADGLVMEYSIECPKHSSSFDYRTGEVDTPPACENLHTYPVKIDNGRIFIQI